MLEKEKFLGVGPRDMTTCKGELHWKVVFKSTKKTTNDNCNLLSIFNSVIQIFKHYLVIPSKKANNKDSKLT